MKIFKLTTLGVLLTTAMPAMAAMTTSQSAHTSTGASNVAQPAPGGSVPISAANNVPTTNAGTTNTVSSYNNSSVTGGTHPLSIQGGTSANTSMHSNINTSQPDLNGVAINNSNGVGTNNNWAKQNTYWQQHYASKPYYNQARPYQTYQPAYQYGYTLYEQNQGKPYSQLDQSQLTQGWNQARGNSQLNWNDAQLATKDAYNRMYKSGPNNRSITNNSRASYNNSWTAQDAYWQQHYGQQPYAANQNYQTYQPAYQYGYTLYQQNKGKPFSQLDQSLVGQGWNNAQGNSNLSWNQAQQATQDAYNRLYS